MGSRCEDYSSVYMEHDAEDLGDRDRNWYTYRASRAEGCHVDVQEN
jgi:hypothetical protein